jgi:hypothetical protein
MKPYDAAATRNSVSPEEQLNRITNHELNYE